MAHFYDCKDRKKPQLITEVTTPAQARKHGKKTYPSITTIIGQTIKDPFLDGIHKPRSMVKYARMEEHWNKEWKEIEQLCYGLVESPDGRTISSAEFGTSVHEAIEKKLWTLKFGGQFEESIYDPYAEPFVDWVIQNCYYIVGVEHKIADNLIKSCGSIDVILKDMEKNQMFICDYKCRKSKQFYPKDLWQMAIECEMLRRNYKLDYLPLCVSVCIDINTKKHYHKHWTLEEMEEAIQIVKLISKLYWKVRM